MLQKYQTLTKIAQEKIVAILRLDDVNKAEKCFDALLKGGIKVVEITFTMPYVNTVLEQCSKKYGNEMLIGAGTVLDSETARIAMLAGAKFIVSPTFNAEVAKLCNRYGLPYFCGIYTPTEALTATEAGVDVVKLFPADNFKPSFIKTIKGPLPNVEVMPTGGISLDTIGEWLKSGAVACGVGGELVKGAKTGDYEQITETAKKFAEAVK